MLSAPFCSIQIRTNFSKAALLVIHSEDDHSCHDGIYQPCQQLLQEEQVFAIGTFLQRSNTSQVHMHDDHCLHDDMYQPCQQLLHNEKVFAVGTFQQRDNNKGTLSKAACLMLHSGDGHGCTMLVTNSVRAAQHRREVCCRALSVASKPQTSTTKQLCG